MTARQVATVTKLFRYPVKSMAGEALSRAWVDLCGVMGDRTYALFEAGDSAEERRLTARQAATLLRYKPRFAEDPVPGTSRSDLPPVWVDTPSNRRYPLYEPRLRDVLCEDTGREFRIVKSEEGIYDQAPILLLSEPSLEALQDMWGTPLDGRRFRGNIYLDVLCNIPFAEEGWLEQRLQIGPDLQLLVQKGCSRCQMINLDPETAERDSSLLRLVQEKRSGYFGIYCQVLQAGEVALGDAVYLLS